MGNRLRTYGWLLAFILLFFVCFKLVGIVGRINGRNNDNPEVLSRRTLGHFDCGIGLSLAKKDVPISTRLTQYKDMDLISALMELIASDDNSVAVPKKISKIDAWGSPYNVEWRTNLVKIVTPMLGRNKNELFIWSSGANGINEYGNGDDIYEGEDWTIYRNENQ